MAMKYLGETLDIHAGGIDLTFPHHENEIAQAESITERPFARFWIHSDICRSNRRRCQSLSAIFIRFATARQGILAGIRTVSVWSVPHRKKLNFTFDGLNAANASIERLRNFESRLKAGKLTTGIDEDIRRQTADALRLYEKRVLTTI